MKKFFLTGWQLPFKTLPGAVWFFVRLFAALGLGMVVSVAFGFWFHVFVSGPLGILAAIGTWSTLQGFRLVERQESDL